MHKRIGIIGGLSPESTVSYYLHITRSCTMQEGFYKDRLAGNPLLVQARDTTLPIFGTAILHAEAALERAVGSV